MPFPERISKLHVFKILALKIRNSKFQKGFSLIEILVALGLILAIILILFTASGSLVSSRNSNLQTVASKIASRQIENLKKGGFAALPANGTTSLSDPDLSKLPASSESQTISDVSWGDGNIKQVTIEVDWQQSNNVNKSIKLETLLTKNGI